MHLAKIVPFILLPLIATGQEILSPAGTTLQAGTEFYPAQNITNGSGLAATPTAENYQTVTHSSASSSTAWTTEAPGRGSSDYFALDPGTAPVPVFLFTFSESHDFTDFIFWGYHFGNPNGNEAKSFTLEFSNDGGATFPNSIDLSSPALSQAAPTTLPFGETFSANAIRLTLTDNWFEDVGGGDRVGLGEVRFLGSTPINPNPIFDASGIVDFGSFPNNPGPTVLILPITNLGGDESLIINPGILESTVFSVAEENLTIAAGLSENITLTFSPPTDGCFRETLSLATNDPEKPTVEITLLGAVNCLFPDPQQPEFSRAEGTFTEDFALTLSTSDPGATLIYTLDGSLPGPDNGLVYDGPIPVTNSTQIRAASYFPGQAPAIRTRSYVRLAEDLIDYSSELPIMIVENFSAGAIPNKNWSTSTQTGGGLQQVARQAAFLCVYEKDPLTETASLNADPAQTSRIGIRVRGAFSSTWPRKPYSVNTWKTHSDDDRSINILGMASDSDWILYYPDPNYDRSLLYNTFIWELSRQTGRWAPEFQFVDVFLNQNGGDLALSDRVGVYVFLEKPTRGSKRLEYDKLSDDGSTGGWLNSINRMDPIPVGGFPSENGSVTPQFFHTAGPNRIQSTSPNTAGSGDDIPRQYNAFINFEDPNGYRINIAQRTAIEEWYRQFEDALYDNDIWQDPTIGYRQHLDTTDFIDYFQMLTLAKQGDGLLLSMFPWVSSHDRKLRMGPMWDFNNGAYGGSTSGTLYFRPDRLWYDRLFDDPGFQREYEDRWFQLREGPLSNLNMAAIIDQQAQAITSGLAGQQSGLNASSWQSRVDGMKTWLQSRADWIDTNFLPPPNFSSAGGIVPPGFQLTITTGQSGTIFYSTDGSDPMDSLTVYSGPITPTGSPEIAARVRTTSGDWSAIRHATFVTGIPASSDHLIVSEINHHPADDAPGTEFIELVNISPTDTIDLTGVAFTTGIHFNFPPGSSLAPSERILIVEDLELFTAHYGIGLPVAGEFANLTKLANSGEQLVITAADGTVLLDFTYDDQDPWPEFADGKGCTLTLLLPHTKPDLSDPSNWRCSAVPHGTPGGDDSLAFSGDPSALAHFVTGGNEPQIILPNTFEFRLMIGADEFIVVVQSSPDLINWESHPLPRQPLSINEDGSATYQLPAENPETANFLRLLISPR
ncbi:CotH kinase family protein [Akkermansiaceae bacterium]|nr:CotH kinase family protein [Akkermansiaceae bacterium]